MSENLKKYGLFYMAVFFLVFAVIAVFANFEQNTEKLKVTVLDVGQGDAIFIESPTGLQVLVDAGPPKSILAELPKFMPFWDRSIDIAIVSHPDLDHIGGFEDVLRMYKVGMIFEPGTIGSSSAYKNIRQEIETKNIPNILARAGTKIDIGAGAYLEFLYPMGSVFDHDPNEASVVLRLVYGETSMLLTGDSTIATEKKLLSAYGPDILDVDFLKVGHHGSDTSTSEALLDVATPEYSMISVGRNNKYDHPHPRVLSVLEEADSHVFRTDLLGSIVIECDIIGKCKTPR